MDAPRPADAPEADPAPRPMTAAELARAVAEAAPQVVGGVVVRVREPLSDHLAVEVRHRGRNVELVLGVAPGLSRLHLAARLPPSVPRPGPFTLQARKRLRPSRVVALEQAPGERVVTLTVSRHRDAGGPWEARLVAELFGRGRLFLLDADGRVVARAGPGGPRGLDVGDPYAPPPPGPGRTEGGEAEGAVTSAALEARYGAWLGAREAAADEAAAARAVAGARRRLERRILAMERDLEALADHAVWRREGELLAAHRHLLARGHEAVTVTDWFADGAPERRIALDPALSPEANVEARFRRARRGERGTATLTARLAEARGQLARLEAGGVPAPGPAGQAARGPARGRGGLPAGLRRFRLAGGWEVIVGRGAAQNERLTFQVARGNDLWLHARGVAGAHVILRGPGEPPPWAVRAAALLAAHFSRLKAAGGGEVLCTPRKHVRRLRGGRPGQVAVSREKVLQVALERGEMARLLAARDTDGAPGP